MKKNLYDLVGVPPVAPREMIAAACRRRIAKLERESTEEARAGIYAVREAWSILGDEKLRAGYDASLAPSTPAAEVDAPSAAARAEIATASLASELLRPRHLLAENWERYRKLVFVLLFVGFIALSAVWNQSRRVELQKRIEAATHEAEYGAEHGRRRLEAATYEAQREAEHGKPQPDPAKAAEPFSAEKFERELKEREAAIQEQVSTELTQKEDEFRDKLQRENDPYGGRRRSRSR